MIIEYICENPECGYTFVDVVIRPKCKCPRCGAETEHEDWIGLSDD